MKKLTPRSGDVPIWKTGGFLAFILGFLSLLITILPIIIAEKGYFIYYGDYNAQQMPFYHLASQAVKSGSFGWNWFTDLGANFIGSYSFYLLGSPFFWLCAILPSSWCIHAMPFVLALKHGIAALTAYAYIKRFVKSRNAAVIGGMLYAFSGFQLFNIFFNHFHDVSALFPLMLIALEELVVNRKKGLFALTVALMAAVNYFFFVGEALFLVLYFIVRCFSKDFPASPRIFLQILIEAVLGVMMACFILLPSALALLSNYRISERLYGSDLVAYNDKTRIWRIIQSFFMIPDVPARPNLFAEGNGKWASIGGYLPLFSMTGVIAFMKHRDGHWAKRLIIICIIFAFIPVLNSAFYMFNSSYYARWFFMPLLIMSLMTALALDEKDYTKLPLKDGILITGGVLLAFAAMFFLPVKEEDGSISYTSMAEYPLHFWIVMAVAVVSLALTVYIASLRKQGKPYFTQSVALIAAASVACTATVVYFGANSYGTAHEYIDKAIDPENDVTISIDENSFFRTDISEDCDNYPMLWGLPCMRCFHSVVPGSIMEFYSDADIGRDVSSRVDTKHYSLRGLFSVKYYFDEIEDDNKNHIESPLPGFEYKEDMNGFHLYENEYFIPMGFSFDSFITKENWLELSETRRTGILIKALVLDEKQAEKYGGILTELTEDDCTMTKQLYLLECENRRNSSCTNFQYDSYGFSAEFESDDETLVFFSVPYESGWSTKVNGADTKIEVVDTGFMAVPVKAGKSSIEFKYETPGLKTGALISLSGLVLYGVYMFAGYTLNKKQRRG